MKRLLAAALVGTGLLISAVAIASAASTAPGGLAVSPAIVELSAGKGQQNLTFTLSVTNDSPSTVSVISRVDDFTALNSTGGVQFLNNVHRAASAHGLAHWMTPELSTFDLESHATRVVTVTIDGLSTMSPGGHYGAVIFGVVPSADTAQFSAVGTTAAVSSLVFLTTDNPGKQAMALVKPELGFIQPTIPNPVNLVFANVGDVQVTPRGLLTMSDPLHREVAREVVNADSGQVLPGTRRLYQVRFSSASQLYLPGLYQLTVAYHVDGQTKSSTYDQTFLYVPPALLAAGGALLLSGLLFGLRRFMPGNLYRLKR